MEVENDENEQEFETDGSIVCRNPLRRHECRMQHGINSGKCVAGGPL